LLYWPATGHEFLPLDDPLYVGENPHVRRGLSAEGLRWAWNVGYAGNWHPLTWVSHMLDVELFGLAPRGHHATSVVLHAANASLLLLVLARASRGARPAAGTLGRSAFVAAAFAAHPLRLESVAWVAERKDVLASCCGLAALAAYVGWTRYGGRARYVALVLAAALGLLAKPMLVSLPLLLLVFDFWPLGRLRIAGGSRSLAAAILEKLPLVALSIASAWLTLRAQRDALAPVEALPLGARAANAVVSYLAYAGQTVLPLDLAAFYPFPAQGWPAWLVVAAATTLAAATLLALAGSRRWPWWTAGWLWYLIMLVPVIGLVQVGLHARADRYTYLPQVGLLWAAAWGAAALARRWRVPRVAVALAAAAVLAGLGIATRTGLAHWQNGVTLFEQALRATRDNYLAHHGLGLAWAERGRLDLAARHAAEAVRLNPDYVPARSQLAYRLAQQGRFDEALAHAARVVEARPSDPGSWFNQGTILLEAGRPAQAADVLRRALELAPGLAGAWTNLALAEERLGREPAARAAHAAAVAAEPESFDSRLRFGEFEIRRRDYPAATEQLLAAARLRPDAAQPQLLLALLEIERGERAAAAERERRLREIDPRAAERVRRWLERPPGSAVEP
jgi:tetratricopeptide (TPR) repeat protein